MALRRQNGRNDDQIHFVVELTDGRSAVFQDLDQARALIRFATARGLECRLSVASETDGGASRIVLSDHLPADRASTKRAEALEHA